MLSHERARLITRPYERGDAACVCCDEPDPYPEFLHQVEIAGRGRLTFELGGAIVGVMGYFELWNGVGEAFAILDRQALRYNALGLVRKTHAHIMEMMRINNLHRIQATASTTDEKAQAFLKVTGYCFESVMHMGGPAGEDLAMFTVLRGRDHEQEDQEGGERRDPGGIQCRREAGHETDPSRDVRDRWGSDPEDAEHGHQR